MFSIARRTQLAYIGMRLMGTPCWCLLSMLTFILYKNAHASPFQVAAIIALKPATSLLSPYWSQAIHERPDKIILNLVGAHFFRYLPFLFVPWVESAWFVIFAFGLYMMLSRATIPAWMELLKYNLPEIKREQLVGYGTIVDYLGTALVSVLAGLILDHNPDSWKWLLFIMSALGILATSWLPTIAPKHSPVETATSPFKMQTTLTKPWKQVWELLRQRKDFMMFQWGFMLGGGGLMIMQPALPQFFIDTLHLSFTEMGLAIALCKGIGVACTAPLWAKLFRKWSIFHFSGLVTFFAALFPFLLLATSWQVTLLYVAYAFYGIMQAGSELSWHMSGLVFSKDKDSSTFSSTNVLTVGIRGCAIPTLGALVLPYCQPIGLMLVGAALCLIASISFLLVGKKGPGFLSESSLL